MKAYETLLIARQFIGLRRSEWWPSEKIRAYQDQRLLRALRFAVSSVPYYRDLKLSVDDLARSDDLSRFPVLTKELQQEHHESLVSDGTDPGDCYVSRTSGSTGEPTTVLFDRDAWLLCKYALKIRRMVDNGVGLGKRVLVVSELGPAEIEAESGLSGQRLLFRQKRISIREPLDRAAEAIIRFRPHAIYAFPSYLAELLEHCERRGIDLSGVEVVFTSSEVLTAGLRRRLGESFAARICDVYGSTEFKEVAWQCDNGRYHINFESTWVEIDPVDGVDRRGVVLLTSLVNRAMPLIRYRVGDTGTLGSGICECGRAGPWIAAVSGREGDMLELPDGRRLSPYLLTTVVESDPAIRRYQIAHVRPDKLEIRYLAGVGSEADEGDLARRLRETLGSAMQVQFRRLEQLPRTPGGKQQVFSREFSDTEDMSSAAGLRRS